VYYLDISSLYRDLNEYPNPTDFAITFKTFSGTGFYVNGDPLNPDNASDYFQQVSIDPDFYNVELTTQAASITQTQINTTDGLVFISGFTELNSTGFSILNAGTSIKDINFETGCQAAYLACISRTFAGFTGTFTFQWAAVAKDTGEIQTEGQPLIPDFTRNSIFTLDNTSSPAWLFDFATADISVELYTKTSKVTYANITNPTHTGSICTSVWYFDSAGSIKRVEGSDWGYHVLYSDAYSTYQSQANGLPSIVVDDSSNVYVNTNVTPFKALPLYNSITGAFPTSQPDSFTSTTVESLGYENTPINNFYYKMTGGGHLGINLMNQTVISTVFSSVSDRPFLMFYETDNFGGLSLRYSVDCFPRPDVNPAPYRFQNLTNITFAQSGPHLFGVGGYANFTGDVGLSSPANFEVFLIDPTNGTITGVASGPNLGLFNWVSAAFVGENLFIGARDSFASTYNIFEFVPATNTLSNVASISVLPNATGYADFPRAYGYDQSGAFYTVEVPSNSWITQSELFWNSDLPSQVNVDFVTGTIYQFDPASTTLTEASKFVTYNTNISASIVTLDSKPVLYLGQNSTPKIMAFDLSNPSGPAPLEDINGTFYYQLVPYFSIGTGPSSHTFVSNSTNIFDVTQPDSVKQIVNPFVNRGFVTTVDPNGNQYGVIGNDFGLNWFKTASPFLEQSIVSTHYNQNPQNLIMTGTLGITADVFALFTTEVKSWAVLVSATDIAVVDVTSIYLASTITTTPYAFSSTPNWASVLVVAEVVWLFVNDGANIKVFSANAISEQPQFIYQTSLAQNETLVQTISYSFREQYFVIGIGLTTFTKWSLDLNTWQLQADAVNFSPIDLENRVGLVYYDPILDILFLEVTELDINKALGGNYVYFEYFDITNQADLSLAYVFPDAIGVDFAPTPFSTASSDFNGLRWIVRYEGYPAAFFGDSLFRAYIYQMETAGKQCVATYNNGTNSFAILNRSNVGATQDQLAIGKLENVTWESFTEITLPGLASQFFVSSINGANTLIALLSDGSFYLYDVTNIDAANNQTVQTQSVTYSCGLTVGSSFIHKISNNGNPEWFTSMQTTDTTTVLGQNINSSRMILQDDKLYVGGTWINDMKIFTYTSTGAVLQNIYSNGIASQGFVGKFKLLDGLPDWIQPLTSKNNCNVNDISFQKSDNQLGVLATVSDSTRLLQRQFMGDLIMPSDVLTVLPNTSATTLNLYSTTDTGLYNWRATVNTFNNLQFVDGVALESDSERFIVAGVTSASTVTGQDSEQKPLQLMYAGGEASSVNIRPTLFTYMFTKDGTYLSSQEVDTTVGCANPLISRPQLVKTDNSIFITTKVQTIQPDQVISFHNKDGTLGAASGLPTTSLYGQVVRYLYDTFFTDSNNVNYTRIVFSTGTSYPWTGGAFINYTEYVGGFPGDPTINKNYKVRDNFIDELGRYTLTLNQTIDTSKLVRLFSEVNGIPGSDDYYIGNLSKSPLAAIATYNIEDMPTIDNTITIKALSPLVAGTQYYIVYPRDDGSGGTYQMIIPILSFTDLGGLSYLLQLTDVNDLRSPDGGPFYGPYLYITAENLSVAYNLNFFPGSLNTAVIYYITLSALTLPNRPLRNLNNKYGGSRSFNDLPYIYVSIYNTDDDGQFDNEIVNLVYDNNPLTVKPFPLFRIDVFETSPSANFVTFSGNAIAKIKFLPQFFNIRIRIFDPDGDVLLFDESDSKPDDETYQSGVPQELLNVYLTVQLQKL
jgi:hypothetical protein